MGAIALPVVLWAVRIVQYYNQGVFTHADVYFLLDIVWVSYSWSFILTLAIPTIWNVYTIPVYTTLFGFVTFTFRRDVLGTVDRGVREIAAVNPTSVVTHPWMYPFMVHACVMLCFLFFPLILYNISRAFVGGFVAAMRAAFA